MADLHISKIKQARVGRDAEHVIIEVERREYLRLPWDAALVLARAITIQARRIEADIKANQIIMDEAFILRKGLPFGLTSNPRMIEEAGKEAAWNKDLRRYLPGGVKSQEAVGTPRLIKHKPKRGKKNGKL